MAAPVWESKVDNPISGAGGSITINKPSGVVSGELMVARILRWGTDDGTVPSGWTFVRRDQLGSGSSMYSHIYWKLAGGSEPTDYTWSWSQTAVTRQGEIHRISGPSTTAPIDVHAGQSNSVNDTTNECPTITPSVDDTLLLGISGLHSAGNTHTPPSGYTERTDYSQGTNLSGSIATKTLATAAATGEIVFAQSFNENIKAGQHIAIAPVVNLPPTAPTLVSPADAATIYRNQTNAFDWTHNDPESDAQSAWALRRRDDE